MNLTTKSEHNSVLVTGNQGYIGSVLVSRLIEKGYRVIGLDIGLFADREFVPQRAEPHAQLRKDVRDVSAEDLKGVDAVIHLAALSNDPVGSLDTEITYNINWRASVRLAELAKAAGVQRFLFSSSCSMYGVASEENVTEENPFYPQTAYAESKVRSERDIRALADDGFAPIFLRNSTVFGVSPRMRFDLVVQNLAAHGYLDGVIRIMSDGSPWRPLIHVEDVADAFCFLLEAPRAKIANQSFNIGREDNNLQIRTIAEMVRDTVPDTKIEILNQNPDDTRSYRVDFSKIKALGWRPRWRVREGVRQLYDVFRAVRFGARDFDSDAFIRLRRYRSLIEHRVLSDDFRLTVSAL